MRVVACLAAAAAVAILGARLPRDVPAAHAWARGPAVCGTERWPVKTLADPGAPHVRLKPNPTRIAVLRRLRVVIGFDGTRGVTAEERTYAVTARLVALKAEDDSDIHLVVADPVTRKTMIAEFPALGCTRGAPPALRRAMERARVAVIHACGFPGNNGYRHVDGSARIAGVAFFDVKHGQNGVAPNGIELHPVLRFRGRCR